MDIEKVVQDLNRRFFEPLPEFYKRRIIFWHDGDKEFEDQIDDIELANAKIIKLTGTNQFKIKKQLTLDDTTSNFLVYCPVSYENPEQNWLMNIELYSGEPFRADLIAIWMDEIGLDFSQNFREIVKRYQKFFKAKERRNKISIFSDKIKKASQIHLAVMAVICGIKELSKDIIIREVLKGGLDIETNAIYQDLVNFKADTAF